jgi:ADP-ribose pyrophosphatase YjhB (NUDIX family)
VAPSPNPRILGWAREIQALAQTGYHYAGDDYQRERCKRLMMIAAEMISGISGLELAPVAAAFQNQVGYATPKVDVRAAVFRGGKLLMVREKMDGAWTMPGGWADVNDIPSEAAERETREEAGLGVKARKVVGVYDANRVDPLEVFHAFKIVFLCDILEGEPCHGAETTDVAFFGPLEVPSELSGERTKPRHISDAFAHLANADCPTFFD